VDKAIVAICSDSFYPYNCGVSEAIENQKKNLTKLGQSVFLITPEYTNYVEYDSQIIRIPSYLADKKRGYRAAKIPFSKETINRILELRPQIFHTHGPYATHALALKIAKKLHIPVVMTWHTLVEDYIRCWVNDKKLPDLIGKVIAKSFIKSWVVPLCNKSDLILAPTNYVKNLLLSYGIKSKIRLLPLAIDLKLPEFNPKTVALLKKGLNIDPNDKIILYTGRITPEKNIQTLINAFRMISSVCPSYHLVLVGGGEIEKYKSLAINFEIPQEKITFVGEVKRENIFEYYFMADIFLFASLTDNTPRTILEAMATDTIVVAVDAGGVGDLIKNNVTGYLVKNNNDVAYNLSRKVIEMDLDKIKRFAQLAKEEVFSVKYKPEHYATTLVNIYRELIDAKNK
jgi:1,2-diacylglycerol 3-alpha-glucosyltransferase